MSRPCKNRGGRGPAGTPLGVSRRREQPHCVGGKDLPSVSPVQKTRRRRAEGHTAGGPFEILDTDGTYFTIDHGDREARVNSDNVTPAHQPVAGPDSQTHRLTRAPLPDVDSTADDPTWEIDC